MGHSSPNTYAVSQKIHKNLVTKFQPTDASSAIAVPITLPPLQARTSEARLRSVRSVRTTAILGTGGVPVGAAIPREVPP